MSDGWFVTGDIGLVDDRGRLYLRGRERDEINKGGMKVYPSDIDAVVERFPDTIDVCAFAFPEATLGEDVGVAVVLGTEDPAALLALYDWTATESREASDPAALVPAAGDPPDLARQGEPPGSGRTMPLADAGEARLAPCRPVCKQLSPVDAA